MSGRDTSVYRNRIDAVLQEKGYTDTDRHEVMIAFDLAVAGQAGVIDALDQTLAEAREDIDDLRMRIDDLENDAEWETERRTT